MLLSVGVLLDLTDLFSVDASREACKSANIQNKKKTRTYRTKSIVCRENSRLAGLTRIAEEDKESLISVFFSIYLGSHIEHPREGKFDPLGIRH